MGGHVVSFRIYQCSPNCAGAVGSMSGAVDISVHDYPEQRKEYQINGNGICPEGATQEVYAANAVLNMVDKMKSIN
jgi:hypothetical protein